MKTKLLMLAILMLVLVSCTATQRGWAHDNIPLIGSLFDPFIPPPVIPVWHKLLSMVAGWYVDSPEVAGPATAAGLAAAQHAVKGLPGTARAKELREKRRIARAAVKSKKDALAKSIVPVTPMTSKST